MEALELDIVSTVGATISDEVRALVDRHEATSGHPGLSEERLRLLERASRGDGPDLLLGVTARRPGATGLLGWSQVDRAASDRTPTLEAVALPELGTDGTDALVDTLLSAVATLGTDRLRWWVGHATDADDDRAAARGFVRERDLLQLRCPLPLATWSDRRSTSAPETRAFRVGHDETAWLVQNNRAFADHPEQGNWGLATLMTREAEPWFDPDGFRILEVDGRIAGSCWTKVHRTTDPHLGEIYVIGVDPDFHGRGWGRALTEDGFAWLASAGLTVGMLYVDPENTAALALYTSMGMTTHHVDRAYVTSQAATGTSSDPSPA